MTTHTAKRPLLDPALVAARARRFLPAPRAAVPVEEPRDVRLLRGEHPHQRPLRARPGRRGRGAPRATSSPSRCGCGSPCSSRTSPKRWPRAAARRRPRACAPRSATSPRRSSTRRTATPRRRPCPAPRCAKATWSSSRRGDFIPADGTVIQGVASVDESAITGESAPVIREAGGDFSSVTGGTRVLSDWLVVRVTVNPGESFLDRMIAMVEGAKRQKTPNEIALTILLVAMTLVFLLACATLLPFSIYAVEVSKQGAPITITDARRPPRVPHPDHHRRPPLGHRRGGHGPHAGEERHRHLRPRRRGRRRRGRAAPRQDRHDHPGQPAGHRLPARARASPTASWPTRPSSPLSPTRRPRAARSWCWPSSASTCASATSPRSAPSSCTSPPRRA